MHTHTSSHSSLPPPLPPSLPQELAGAKPGLVVINMGRGPLIVEEDLVKALTNGTIKGAALDVFDTGKQAICLLPPSLPPSLPSSQAPCLWLPNPSQSNYVLYFHPCLTSPLPSLPPSLEPLPSDSPFWGLPNVLLSPHNMDMTSTFLDESVRFFSENCGRFVKGGALRNLVDKKAGY